MTETGGEERAGADVDPSGPSGPTRRRLAPGLRVEVRSRFDGDWADGFEVVEALEDGYRLRRLSDDSVLPVLLAAADVRRERRRGMWWI